jgi:hypothetical protein
VPELELAYACAYAAAVLVAACVEAASALRRVCEGEGAPRARACQTENTGIQFLEDQEAENEGGRERGRESANILCEEN